MGVWVPVFLKQIVCRENVFSKIVFVILATGAAAFFSLVVVLRHNLFAGFGNQVSSAGMIVPAKSFPLGALLKLPTE